MSSHLQRFLLNLCAEEIVLSHLSYRSTTSVCSRQPGRTTLPDEMDYGCNSRKVPLQIYYTTWVAGVLRHDHNQRTHGSDGIVNYERAWRAVKILTGGGIAAVGADTRQGLLVSSSFRGHQRPTCHLTDSRDCLKTSLSTDATHHLPRCQRLPLPKASTEASSYLQTDSPFSIFVGAQTISIPYVPHPSRPSWPNLIASYPPAFPLLHPFHLSI